MRLPRPFVPCLVVIALAACGGGASESGGAAARSDHERDHEQHPGPSIAEVDAMHAEIAPVFHAEPGAVRTRAACERASVLHERAIAVQAVPTPAGVDGDHWHGATASLSGAADGLALECSTSGPAVEERLSDLHDAFHRVAELSGGEEGEHHDEGDHHDEGERPASALDAGTPHR